MKHSSIEYYNLDSLHYPISNCTIGFTGTQLEMTVYQIFVLGILFNIFRPIEFHHGDCIGADADAHEVAEFFKNYFNLKNFNLKIVIHPSNINSKRAFKNGDRILKSLNPLQRNKNIVYISNIVVAAPYQEHEILRSGTWATIRYAKKINKPLIIIHPNKEFETECRNQKEDAN